VGVVVIGTTGAGEGVRGALVTGGDEGTGGTGAVGITGAEEVMGASVTGGDGATGGVGAASASTTGASITAPTCRSAQEPHWRLFGRFTRQVNLSQALASIHQSTVRP
jgi:hypothetical protein